MLIDWINTDIAVKQIAIKQWPGGARINPHWTGFVPHQQVWVPIKGQGKILTHLGEVAFRKGTVFWLKPGFCYRVKQTPSRPLCYYCLEFDLFNVNGNVLDQHLQLPTEVILKADSIYLHTLFNDVTSMTSEFSSTLEQHALQEKIMHSGKVILMQIDERASGEDAPTRLDYLYATKDDPLAMIAYRLQHEPAYRPTVKELAKQAYMSYNNFCLSFKKRFGKTLKQYAILCRINHASNLLLETPLKIKDIAHILGYEDPQLFSKQFQQHMKMTPVHYRRQKRQQQDETKKAVGRKLRNKTQKQTQ